MGQERDLNGQKTHLPIPLRMSAVPIVVGHIKSP